MMNDGGTRTGHEYDLNGIFGIHLDQDFPLLEEKWQRWKASPSGPVLTIRRGEISNNMTALDQDTSFREGAYQIAFGKDVFEVGRGSIICSGRVIERNLEHSIIVPVINRIIPKKGIYLARASAVTVGDQFHAFFGISGSGKTSVLLEHLIRGTGYVGDGKIYIDRYGICTTYSPMICFHTRNIDLFPELLPRIFPDVKERRLHERRISFRRFGHSLKDNNFLTEIVRKLMLSGSGLSYFAPTEDVFPHCPIRTKGIIARSFLVQRGGGHTSVNKITADEAASQVATSEWIQAKSGGYCHNTLAELAGLDFCTKADYQNILVDFFSKADCYRLRIPPNATRETFKTVVDILQGL